MSRKVCVWREVKVSRAVCIVHVYFSLHRYSICRNYRHHIIYYIVYVILKIYDILIYVLLRSGCKLSPSDRIQCLRLSGLHLACHRHHHEHQQQHQQQPGKHLVLNSVVNLPPVIFQNFRVSSHQQTNSFGQCIFTSRITTIITTGMRSVHILPDYRESEKLS